jgi:hypothetical protein
MISEEQIIEILSSTVKKLKKNVNIQGDPRIDLEKFKPNPVYSVTVKLWNDIRVHSEGQIFPESLFKNKFPNEDEDVFKYRKDNYQPVTESDWNRGIVNYDRVFNPQNYDIDWKDDEYFTKEYPRGPILSHYKSVVKGKKLEDPNAVIALWIENQNAADNIERLPTDIIYHADKVLQETKEFIFLMSEEKSIVFSGQNRRKIGFIFYLYDDAKIYKITQIGKFNDYKFDIEVWFDHDFGYVPAQRLKGHIFEINGIIYYKSYANSAVPPLNIKAVNNSTLQASVQRHAYLDKWEIDDECPNHNCQNGVEFVSNEEQTEEIKRTCTICHGTCRNLKNKGPLGIKKVIKESDEPIDASLIPPMGYIEKDPTILQFLQDQIDLQEVNSFLYLGIDISNTNAKGTEPALSKIVDRESLENGLTLFSGEIWDTLRFNVKFCNDARDVLNTRKIKDDPDIKDPKTFTIRTEKNLTEEFNEAKDLPDAYRSVIFKQLVKARFGTATFLQLTLKLKQLVDRLFLANSKDLSIKKAQGTAQAWEIVLHDSFDSYVARELTKDETFLDNIEGDWETIKAQFEAQAKADTVTTNGSVEDLTEE